MKNILKLNAISNKVTEVFKDNYTLTENSSDALGIMVRSFNMHEYTPSDSVLCVGRAGAGTNNIPVKDYAEKGIVVFNTPGANSNAVKELVLGALILSSRKFYEGISWAQNLTDGEKTIAEQVEKGKKAFVGCEIFGKTLGVYGLGAIGKKIAQSAHALGMNVIGFDPYLPSDAVIEGVTIVSDKNELFKNSDYITLHVPLTNETREMINADTISIMKDGVRIINASRGEIVCEKDVVSATESGKVACFVTDFPDANVVGKKNVLTIPHLGASTEEAEDNCAVMAASQMVDYIENGNIVNSVNYPRLTAERNGARTLVLCKASAVEKVKSVLSGCVISAVKNDFGAVICDGAKQDVSKIVSIADVIKVREL